MGYIDKLIANCLTAKEAKPLREFLMKDLSELSNIKSAIYIIEQDGGDIQKTFEDFLNYKNLKERKCPKLNNFSPVLYVGSSTKNLKERIIQHIGDGHKDTYALNLKYWFCGSYKILIKEYDVPHDVLQIIEDETSYKLRPAFGKQGGNNK